MEENIINKEFKVLGHSMEYISIFYGLFLIIWGAAISFISGSNSLTSFIPSFFGLPILIFAFLTVKYQEKKKLFMHIVVTFGLLVFIGGMDISRGILKNNLFENFYADLSKLMMLLTGLIFTIMCVKSFIFARKNK
jgi:phosphate/sulfate permease|tara:strand:- start:228 stop:635 length:408 start_codon:yes stop_codon:yes gene_type:complete